MSGKPPTSAGVLFHRAGANGVEVLLIHPGGPFWRRKDAGAWQIPKGMIGDEEAAEEAARREVAEELGFEVTAPLVPLGSVRQSGGKQVVAYAADQDVDAGAIRSNSFTVEWPPRSGTMADFPEVDAARWFTLAEARTMMLLSQQPFLDRL